MEGQTPPRLAHSASGHVCNNCGWAFPNSHPSAKQRRSHRKVCGTIEGQKKPGLVDLNGSSHSNVSDDERERRLSEDTDFKNPSSEEEKGIGESRKKSEDDFYSDATTEFSGAVEKGSAINVENDSKMEPEIEGIKQQGSTIKSLSTCKSEYFQSEESAFMLNEDPTKFETQKDGDFEGSSTLAVDDNTKAAGESPDSDDGKSHENSDKFAEKNEDVLVVSVADVLLGNNGDEVTLEDFKDHKVRPNHSFAPEFDLAKETEIASIPRVVSDEESGLSEIEAPKRSDDLAVPEMVSDLNSKESGEDEAKASDIESHSDDRGKALSFGSEMGDSEKANAIRGACDGDNDDDLKNGQEMKSFAVNSPEYGIAKDEIRVESDTKNSTKEGFSEPANEVLKPSKDIESETQKDVKDETRVESDIQNSTKENLSESVNEVLMKPSEDHETETQKDQQLLEYGIVKDDIRVESDIQNSTKKEGLSESANEVLMKPSGGHGTETPKDQPLEQIVTSESAKEDVVCVSMDMVSDAKEVASEKKPTPTMEEKTSPARESMNVASAKSDRQQTGGSVVDISADSGSPTDSLENNWGSVSGVSTQSEICKKPRAAANPTLPEKAAAEETEAPSFMTLVEPTADQSGWFPRGAHGPNESEGRKKNEEIIAKVTHWGDQQQQQRTPLKSLLDEPSNKQTSPPKSTTVNSILAHKETQIKREKRRSNPFMCCIRI